jgi:hypothetical protein
MARPFARASWRSFVHPLLYSSAAARDHRLGVLDIKSRSPGPCQGVE